MPIPVVAIVGRPNVGKSSLFNWLAGKRIAIVDPTAGVTRDRVSTLLQLGERYFELVDTGGMGIQDIDNLTADVERQIQHALDRANVVLFVVDARDGLMALDQEVGERLRSLGKPVISVANKCDAPSLDPNAAEFHRLGYGQVLYVSAQQNRGKQELLDAIQEQLPPGDDGPPPAAVALKLAIVGRRNTGKSTFINRLAQEERVIVSEVPGTTRDSIDVRFERNEQVFLAIDTAGVRKKGSVQTDIEFYSLARAERSIRRADVVLLFLDASLKISQVDKQLAGYILEQHKPAIFVANKWDLLKDKIATGEFGDYLHKVFPSLDYVPISFITAKTGKNAQMLLDLAQALHTQAGERVTTGECNRVLREALEDQPPPLRQNRRAKIYFATQVATNPPTIVLFTNGPELFDNTYQRYLLKVFRDRLPFSEVPIKLYLRRKPREEESDAPATESPKRPPARKPKGKQRGKRKPESELWTD